MLWYQGEAEGLRKRSETYLARFTQFVGALRRELNQPELPVITVQLNRCMTPCDTALDRQWGMVRRRRSPLRAASPAYVLPSSDVALYDFIHNSAQGNLVSMVKRCALRAGRAFTESR